MINMNICHPWFNKKKHCISMNFGTIKKHKYMHIIAIAFLQQITVGRKVEDVVDTNYFLCAPRIHNDDASILFKGIKGERVVCYNQ